MYVIPAYTKECMDFPEAIKNIIRQNPNEDIIFGESVNNDLQKIDSADKKLHLVAGINLPFLLQFLTFDQ